MVQQKPIQVGLMATVDQVAALVDEMVGHARQHRTEHCVHRAAGCIGDGLIEYMTDELGTPDGRRRMLLLLCGALARLADQPESSTTVEGISP